MERSMMKIKNVKVYGLEESITRSGFPLSIDINKCSADKNRFKKLAKSTSGSGHDHFLAGIIVQFDILYPEYLSPELQRYHWFEIVSSMSKMHRIKNMDLKSQCNKYVENSTITLIKKLQKKYNTDPSYENFITLLSNTPLGLEKWMGISTNYLQLKTIYKQRKNHKLVEDWGCICDMIKNLPMFNLIIE